MKNAKLNYLKVSMVVILILFIFSAWMFYFSFKNPLKTILGYITSTGEANLTVETSGIINFTNSQINWGSGRVNVGSQSATLTTEETNNVTNGNWTLQNSGGLRIENLGNVNLTLNISGTKTAAQMIGGSSPSYEWIFSQLESGSCLNSTGGTIVFQDYGSVYTTTTEVCGRFRFKDSNDSIRIDFRLIIPSDSKIGALGDTITATAFATA